VDQLRSITLLQWIGIVILFNTTLLGGASQLGDLSLSAVVVKAILAFATLGNGFLGGLVTMFGGQGTQTRNVIADPAAQEAIVKAVLAMPGVENLKVNAKASATLATIAVDEGQPKIEAVPADEAKVVSIAKMAG